MYVYEQTEVCFLTWTWLKRLLETISPCLQDRTKENKKTFEKVCVSTVGKINAKILGCT